MTRRLLLVRHGETEGQSSIRYHGRNDVPLSAVGRAQIEALVPLLVGTAPRRIIHSPLSRARDSARILARGLGLDECLLQADERLREISFGDCEGMTAAEIAAAFPEFWAQHQAGLVDAFPGGESRLAFARRVANAFAELGSGDWDGDLLHVSHRGTLRHGLRALLAVPAAAPDEFIVELGSLTVLRWDGGWQLEQLGVRPDGAPQP